MRRPFLTITALAALAACGSQQSRNELGGVREPAPAGNAAADNAAAPAAPAQGNVASTGARRETLTATFAEWEMGDYLWARFQVPGREPVRAMVEGYANSLFLDAHRGQPLTVEIATVMMDVPEAGGETEVVRLVSARNAEGPAEIWFARLSPAERAAAQQRFDRALSGGR